MASIFYFCALLELVISSLTTLLLFRSEEPRVDDSRAPSILGSSNQTAPNSGISFTTNGSLSLALLNSTVTHEQSTLVSSSKPNVSLGQSLLEYLSIACAWLSRFVSRLLHVRACHLGSLNDFYPLIYSPSVPFYDRSTARCNYEVAYPRCASLSALPYFLQPNVNHNLFSLIHCHGRTLGI